MTDSYALLDEQQPDAIPTTDPSPPEAGFRGHRARAGVEPAGTTGPSDFADAEGLGGDEMGRPGIGIIAGSLQTNRVDPGLAASDGACEVSPPSQGVHPIGQATARRAAPVLSPNIGDAAKIDADGLPAPGHQGHPLDVAAGIPPEVGGVGGPSDAVRPLGADETTGQSQAPRIRRRPAAARRPDAPLGVMEAAPRSSRIDDGQAKLPGEQQPSAEGAAAARPAKGATRGARARTVAPEDRSDDGQEIVGAIRVEQHKIAAGEGDVIASNLAIGKYLALLKAASKRDWVKRLKELGYNPRVASRLMMVARSWDGENGRIASDLLPQLPVDLNKLEWLCKLPYEQLRELLQGFDCKKSARKDVANRVKVALGGGASAPKPRKRDPIKGIDRLFDSVVGRVTRLRSDVADEAGVEQFRSSLEARIARLSEAFGS